VRYHYQTGVRSAPLVIDQLTTIKIIHPNSPYLGQEALISRVKQGPHVDLIVALPDGSRITIDSTWTDYWEQRGDPPTYVPRLLDVDRALVMKEMLGRWKRHSEAVCATGK
jgi:hypothetical protein